MNNKLIIDGNAVYEIDEECMRKRTEENNKKTDVNKSKEVNKRKRTR